MRVVVIASLLALCAISMAEEVDNDSTHGTLPPPTINKSKQSGVRSVSHAAAAAGHISDHKAKVRSGDTPSACLAETFCCDCGCTNCGNQTWCAENHGGDCGSCSTGWTGCGYMAPHGASGGTPSNTSSGSSASPHCASSVVHNGDFYATLDAGDPEHSAGAVCQDFFLDLPAGWIVAPHDESSIAVTAAYPWGTHILVYADGGQRYTNHPDYQSQAGQSRPWYVGSDGDTALGTQGNSYKANACARRILLKALPDACSSSGANETFTETSGNRLLKH
jgi:hypothetical protein